MFTRRAFVGEYQCRRIGARVLQLAIFIAHGREAGGHLHRDFALQQAAGFERFFRTCGDRSVIDRAGHCDSEQSRRFELVKGFCLDDGMVDRGSPSCEPAPNLPATP